MIRFRHKGNFQNTERFFRNALKLSPRKILEKYGQAGVRALSEHTPIQTGKTAASWGYEIEENPKGYALYFYNGNIQSGVNIAIILQYGHGTGTGGYVRGIDYINPALRPVFERLAGDAWREVTRA